MKVDGLIKLHKQFQNADFSLKESCGDGYLCAHNKVFRGIRKKALDFGVKYSVGGSAHWLDYVVFPLVCFQEILDKNEVPYVDNFNVLRRLARRHPKMVLPEKFIRDSLKRNYVLHESCHCIAHRYFADKTDSNGAKFSEKYSPELLKTTNSLLSEAFANSIERFSESFADSPAHIFLHVINSYVPYDPKSHGMMIKSSEEFGEKAYFELVFASYLFNNLLEYSHTIETVKKIIERFAPSGSKNNKEKNELLTEALFRCCRLNPRFRDETSAVFFSSMNLEREYNSITYEKVIDDEFFCHYVRRAAGELYDLIF